MSEPPHPAAEEPLFNAPAPVVAITAAILASYLVQTLIADGQEWGLKFGVSGQGLRAGGWWTPFTALFVHGGWAHALMNGLGALAFGTPVARLFAQAGQGPLRFYLFYFACGIVANLGFAVLNWDSPVPAVGASGAVLGLMGAASRLLFAPPGRVWPIFSRMPLTMAAALTVIGVLIWVTGITPGMDGAEVAWEAHLFGFLAGLFLLGPFARLGGASR
jgi:membrane associated rhomboid family serine protease